MPVKYLLPFLFVGLSGCDRADIPPPADRMEEATVLDRETLKPFDQGLRGTGRLQFHRPLRGVNSREHYILEWQAPTDGAILTLHSHFNGFAHLDGVGVDFRRSGSHLVVALASPGYPARELFTLEDVFRATPWIRLRVELHDGDVNGVRLLVWRDFLSLQGEIRRRRDRVQPGNADFDSRAANFWFHSHGRGPFWGLSAEGITLLKAYREAPYVD